MPKERIISTVWLGILAYYFVFCMKLFSHNPGYHSLTFTVMATTASIFFALFAYTKAYKVMLLQPDQLFVFPARCMASIWVGSLACMATMSILTKNTLINYQLTTANYALLALITLCAFLAGWIFFYRILLLPRVNDQKLPPTYKQRIISAIWFGIMGYLIALIVFNAEPKGTIDIFTLLLASYLGFTYGYRILMLPTSMKGMIKSIMIGLIGNSYALSIIFLLCISGFIFDALFISPNTFNQPYPDSNGDILGFSFAMMFFLFPVLSIFIGGTGMVISLAFYLLSRCMSR